jgi:hypothetical protein
VHPFDGRLGKAEQRQDAYHVNDESRAESRPRPERSEEKPAERRPEDARERAKSLHGALGRSTKRNTRIAAKARKIAPGPSPASIRNTAEKTDDRAEAKVPMAPCRPSRLMSRFLK